ncbi:MAG: hypothetical protein UT34_C0001G0245 [candidate division WS6 bacterium GW2011_GWF2_39_15]|uniref:Uncharacterized protein n=1 Tax=candidate division WS6 bacterium GW2011_GWF2_39_15 TaxID=1619100 RepID=A0A0G0Q709_9BACT|nr:MAG: hypothetical protein UT34_C0001G0245 [candidate division WS6 bacterium GW2011_GWF2_39_15]
MPPRSNMEISSLMRERPSLAILQCDLLQHGLEFDSIIEGDLPWHEIVVGCRSASAVVNETLIQFPGRVTFPERENSVLRCGNHIIEGPYIGITVSNPRSNAEIIVLSGRNGCVHINLDRRKNLSTFYQTAPLTEFQQGVLF